MTTKVLDWKFASFTVYMASRLQWDAVDYDPYSTFEEMQADYQKTGRIKVTTLHSANSIYGYEWINVCGRAWHDYCHLTMNAGFNQDGERKAAQLQIRQVREHFGWTLESDKFCRIIDAEVNGQVSYYLQYGDFPVNGYEFTKGYLNA